MKGSNDSGFEGLDRVIKEAVAALEHSREEIISIADTFSDEKTRLQQELKEVRIQVENTVVEVDRLEKEEKRARRNLMEVSRDFQRYTEADMQVAYERAKELQIGLGLLREREVQLRLRRDYLEKSLRRLDEMHRKAQELISSLSMAIKVLNGELQQVEARLGELQQRHLLSLKIIEAQEEERRRVAREIHDGPAQALANLVMRTELCLKVLDLNPQGIRAELNDYLRLIKETLKEIRKIIFDLRPMVLDDLGLIPALYRYLHEYQEKYGLEVDLVIVDQEEEALLRIDGAAEIGLFRVIQEALNNVWKHSGARQAVIRLEARPDNLTVSISDNGCGFKPEETAAKMTYGLPGMRERVRLLGGRLEIKSSPGKGTEVRVSIPARK